MPCNSTALQNLRPLAFFSKDFSACFLLFWILQCYSFQMQSGDTGWPHDSHLYHRIITLLSKSFHPPLRTEHIPCRQPILPSLALPYLSCRLILSTAPEHDSRPGLFWALEGQQETKHTSATLLVCSERIHRHHAESNLPQGGDI